MRAITLFCAAGLLEVGGGYLVWIWLREHRGQIVGMAGLGLGDQRQPTGRSRLDRDRRMPRWGYGHDVAARLFELTTGQRETRRVAACNARQCADSIRRADTLHYAT
jgi:YnfA/UPF0060 family uncharacterized protein